MKPTIPLPPRRVTTEEIATYFKVTTRTVASWRDRGLPYIRVNARVIRYSLEECERFVAGKN